MVAITLFPSNPQSRMQIYDREILNFGNPLNSRNNFARYDTVVYSERVAIRYGRRTQKDPRAS